MTENFYTKKNLHLVCISETISLIFVKNNICNLNIKLVFQVKETKQEELQKKEDEDEKEDEAVATYDELKTYKDILNLLHPGKQTKNLLTQNNYAQ
jgi:hypothetical protein